MTPRKAKLTEEEIEFSRQMEWMRVNRSDKWRKIQRMKLEEEHKRKKERTNGNIS